MPPLHHFNRESMPLYGALDWQEEFPQNVRMRNTAPPSDCGIFLDRDAKCVTVFFQEAKIKGVPKWRKS